MALHEIYKGMHIDGLILEKNDAMDIYADGFVTNVSVNSGGSIDIYSGGTATRTTVNKGGGLYISSGGTATAIKENGGFVSVYGYNTYVTFVPSTIDGITLSSFMTVHSNTVANDISIYNSGAVYIHSGGIADKTTVNSGGYMAIYSGGTATNTTANKGGWMDIYSGGTATIKENGGHVDVEKGANVTFVPNTIDNLTLSMHELMTVHKNTVAYNTTLDGWGHMRIYSGELGSLKNYSTRTKITAMSGLNPVKKQSGSSVNSTRLSKKGSPVVRRFLYMASTTAMPRIPILQELYDRVLSKGNSRLQARCAVMRKMLLILRGMVIADKEFDKNFKKIQKSA